MANILINTLHMKMLFFAFETRKLGAWRGMSPDLDPCCGGDGVASADLASLQVPMDPWIWIAPRPQRGSFGPRQALCAKFPKVKFLVTDARPGRAMIDSLLKMSTFSFRFAKIGIEWDSSCFGTGSESCKSA